MCLQEPSRTSKEEGLRLDTELNSSGAHSLPPTRSPGFLSISSDQWSAKDFHPYLPRKAPCAHSLTTTTMTAVDVPALWPADLQSWPSSVSFTTLSQSGNILWVFFPSIFHCQCSTHTHSCPLSPEYLTLRSEMSCPHPVMEIREIARHRPPDPEGRFVHGSLVKPWCLCCPSSLLGMKILAHQLLIMAPVW